MELNDFPTAGDYAGSRYQHASDKIAQLERRVAALEGTVVEMASLLTGAFAEVSRQLQGLGAEG